MVIRWAHPSPKRGYEPEHFDWWTKEIQARTDGRIKIEVYWGGALANFKEMAESVKAGMADVGWVTSAYHPGFLDMTRAAHSAQLLNPEKDPVKYMEKWNRYLERMPEIYEYDAKRNNIIPISAIYYDEYWIFSKKPIRTLADLKGLKIRAISTPHQVAFKAFGASPTFIGAGEMYSALEKGILDAVSYSPDTAKRYNIHEITKYLTKISLQPGCAYWTMNLDTFKKLSWLDQKILLDMGRQASMDKAAFMAKERNRALETFKQAGMEVIEFSQEDINKLKNLPELKESAKDWIKEKNGEGDGGRKGHEHVL